MGRVGALLLGFALGGCHARGEVAAPAPADAAPVQEQLDALIVPPSPGQVRFAECPFDPDEVPPLEDLVADVKLPEFRADRSRASNYLSGDDYLDDVTLSEHMAGVQDQILDCIDIAACYADETNVELVGEVAMELEVSSSGRVRAASVDVTEALAVDPIVPCARRAIAGLRFPEIDGGNTFVSYALTIE